MQTASRLWIIAGILGIGLLLYLLGPILAPFFISALLAWLGDPVVDKLQTWKFPRAVAVLVVFVATFLILALLILLIVPMISREVAALTGRAPQFLAWYEQTGAPWLAVHLHVDADRLQMPSLSAAVSENFSNVGQLAGNVFATVSHSGHLVFVFLINLLLVPVVTFYWLRDWDIFKSRINRLLPRQQSHAIRRMAHECERVLAAFFRGQLLVMASLALVYSVGLRLVGLHDGIAIGVIAGLLGFVPYLGITTGVVLALLSSVLQADSGWLPLLVLAVFACGQGLDSFFLTPRLVGGRIGLHPVLVIFAILAGGDLFGFVGVVLALPAAAAGTVFVRHAYAHYLESDLYRGGEP